MKNIIYFMYFVLKTNYPDLRTSLNCCVKNGQKRFPLIMDMTYSSLRYGASFVDFFNYKFHMKTHEVRKEYATMGYMFQFHRRVNDRSKSRDVDNKILFSRFFREFCNKSYIFQNSQLSQLEYFLHAQTGKQIVIKDPHSTAGKNILVTKVEKTGSLIQIEKMSVSDFVCSQFATKDSIYIEEFIQQHKRLDELSPSGVNTIRVISLLHHGEVEIIGTILRISVNCTVDNFSTGNLAADIDPQTGIVITGGIRKQCSCDDYHDTHPVTHNKIKGFQIPYWGDVIRIVKKAALVIPEVRSIGWDIAITNNGPILIEGNSKWGKDTWQIPAGHGKKQILENILSRSDI